MQDACNDSMYAFERHRMDLTLVAEPLARQVCAAQCALSSHGMAAAKQLSGRRAPRGNSWKSGGNARVSVSDISLSNDCRYGTVLYGTVPDVTKSPRGEDYQRPFSVRVR